MGQSVGRPLRFAGEESPGSMEMRCRVTPGGGDLRESATESRPPAHAPARVKGCGKSAPRARQRERHGKPHREQDRIGAARASCPGWSPSSRPGWLHETSGNGRPRGMAVARGSGPAAQNPAYRPADPGLCRCDAHSDTIWSFGSSHFQAKWCPQRDEPLRLKTLRPHLSTNCDPRATPRAGPARPRGQGPDRQPFLKLACA